MLFVNSSHQKDVIVFANGNQDCEQEHRHLPVESRELGICRPEESVCRAQGHKITEEHRQNQIRTEGDSPQEHDKNHEDSENHKQIDPNLIPVSHGFQVSNTGR